MEVTEAPAARRPEGLPDEEVVRRRYNQRLYRAIPRRLAHASIPGASKH